MKLLDLNISVKLDNNEKVVKLLNDTKCDIITLQEVMRGIDSGVYDRFNSSKIIKDNLNDSYKYSFFGALWIAKQHIKNGVISKDYGGNVEQGNEVISIHPIVEAENVFFYKNYSPFIDTSNFKKTDHPRALEKVILQIDDKQVQILNVHGIWNDGKTGDERTIRECQFILKEALKREIPTIIVGDFNLSPLSESINIINERFINLIDEYDIKSTRPIEKGNMVDDYIFVNDMIKINNFQVIKTDTSDHYCLMLDFDIKSYL